MGERCTHSLRARGRSLKRHCAGLGLAALLAAPAFADDAAPIEPVADLDLQFAPYSQAPDPYVRPAGAVDLNSFESPLEEAGRDLGMGVASYYGRRFHGRLTANGERFNMRAMTAAHKTLPFGSRVKVTNPSNGRSVTVRINDRGPFIPGRVLDLSRGAAERIGMIRSGHARVQMVLLN